LPPPSVASAWLEEIVQRSITEVLFPKKHPPPFPFSDSALLAIRLQFRSVTPAFSQ
jgi:hypothetical protein